MGSTCGGTRLGMPEICLRLVAECSQGVSGTSGRGYQRLFYILQLLLVAKTPDCLKWFVFVLIFALPRGV